LNQYVLHAIKDVNKKLVNILAN